MKKTLINIALALVVIIGFIVLVTAKGLTWFLAFIPTYLAVVELIKLNTNWLEEV